MSSAFHIPPCAWIGLPFADVAAASPDIFGAFSPETMGESLYVNARPHGIALALSRKKCVEAVFLYAEGVEDFSRYQAALPGGVTFTSTRAVARAALGAPSLSGDVGGIGIMAIEHAFDRFEDAAHYVRFTYWADDAGVRLVTIGAA
jgi:hypothetical protein